MKNKDSSAWAAVRLLRASEQRRIQPSQRFEKALDKVLDEAKLLERWLGTAQLASQRGWDSSARLLESRVKEVLSQLQAAVTLAIGHSSNSMVLKPSLRDQYQELIQLQIEFDQVEVERKRGVIAAITDAIELKDIHLGPFRIELQLARLASAADMSVFNIVALDPHPPATSEDVTHPHVRDNQLCAGDATAPINHALREGRICDAFLAINAVLHTYNPHSPFVRLADWHGTPCADCGCSVDEDCSYYCDDCGQSFCEDCYSICDICQTSCCRGCLEKDSVSEQLCCKGCHRTCGRCSRMVDADSFESDIELCPGCHEQFLQEQQDEEELLPEEIQDDVPHSVSPNSSPATPFISTSA